MSVSRTAIQTDFRESNNAKEPQSKTNSSQPSDRTRTVKPDSKSETDRSPIHIDSDLSTPSNSSLVTRAIAADSLPKVQIEDAGQNAEKNQSRGTDISATVDALNQAFDKNDGNKAYLLLATRSNEELSLIAATFNDRYGSAEDFASRIKALREPDELRINTILRHQDGTLNTADFLKEILAGDQKRKAERLLDFISLLEPSSLSKLAADYKSRDGGNTIERDIQSGEGLPPRLKIALTDYLAGLSRLKNDQNTNVYSPQALADVRDPLLKTAISLAEDKPFETPSDVVLKLLQVSLGGDSQGATAERAKLTGPSAAEHLKLFGVKDFNSDGKLDLGDLDTLFNQNRIASDYVKKGRIQLNTIVEGNNGNWFEGDNRKNVELALRTATVEERLLFARGKVLKESDLQNQSAILSQQDQQAILFYQKLHEALDKIGDSRELAFWEEKVISAKADSIENSGNAGSLAGALHDRRGDPSAIFALVDRLNEAEWSQLHNPQTRDALLARVKLALDGKSYEEVVLKALREKGQTGSFDDSLLTSISVADRIRFDKKNAIAILEGIDASTAGAIKKSRLNEKTGTDATNLYQEIKNSIKKLDGQEKAVAGRLLEQVSMTGNAAYRDHFDHALLELNKNIPDSYAAARHLVAGFEQNTDYAKHIFNVVANNKPFSKKDADVQEAFVRVFAVIGRNNELDAQQSYSRYRDEILNDRTIPAVNLVQIGIPGTSTLYTEFASAIKKESLAGKHFDRQAWQQRIRPEGFAILENVIKQDGSIKEEDQIRSFVLSKSPTSSEIGKILSALPADQLQSVKDKYAAKYGSNIELDLLSKVNQQEVNTFVRLLRPFATDAREAYLQNVDTFLKTKGGHSPDYSQWTASRILDLNKESLTKISAEAAASFETAYKSLPAQKQEEYNLLFGEAVSQYAESKANYAEKISKLTALVTFAASFGPQGFILSFAVAESLNLAAQKSIRGNDFKLSAATIGKDAFVTYASFKLGKILNTRGAAEPIEEAASLAHARLAQEIGESALPVASQQKLSETIKSGLISGKAFTPADAARLGAKDSAQAGKVTQVLNEAAAAARTNQKLLRLIAENATQDLTASSAYSAFSGSFSPSDLLNNLVPGATVVIAAKGVQSGALRLKRNLKGAIEASAIGDVSEFTTKDARGLEHQIRFEGGATETFTIAEGAKIVRINDHELAGYAAEQTPNPKSSGLIPIHPDQLRLTYNVSLTERQVSALEELKKGGDINAYLRLDQPLPPRIQTIVEDADSAFRSAQGTVKDMVLYRGDVGPNTLDGAQSLIGSDLIDKGYKATSTSSQLAEKFAGLGKPLYVLHVPAGTPAIEIPDARHPESETLIHRNSRFKVFNASQREDGRIIIEAKYVADHAFSDGISATFPKLSSIGAAPRQTKDLSDQTLKDLLYGELAVRSEKVEEIVAQDVYRGSIKRKGGGSLEVLVKQPPEESLHNPELLNDFNKNLDTAIASTVVSNHLFGSAAATAPREYSFHGQTIEIAVQENTGTTLSESLRHWAKAKYGSTDSASQAKILDETPLLSAEFERASVERFVLGIKDNHTENYTVQFDGNTARIRNIDFEGAFSLDTAPVWPALKDGAAQAIHGRFSKSPLSPETQDRLKEFVEYFTTTQGNKKLKDFDLSAEQIDSMLIRAKWLIDNKTLPQKFSRIRS